MIPARARAHERDRQTETERDRERQTDRDRERQTDRHREIEITRDDSTGMPVPESFVPRLTPLENSTVTRRALVMQGPLRIAVLPQHSNQSTGRDATSLVAYHPEKNPHCR